MINPINCLPPGAPGAATRQRLDDFAQRQEQRERALDALVHHQQTLTHHLQHLARDVHHLGDAMMRLEDRLRTPRPRRASAPAAPAGIASLRRGR
ncbi:MAG: hypothetical protein ACRYHA_16535 [Janthinobacterium lividum]